MKSYCALLILGFTLVAGLPERDHPVEAKPGRGLIRSGYSLFIPDEIWETERPFPEGLLLAGRVSTAKTYGAVLVQARVRLRKPTASRWRFAIVPRSGLAVEVNESLRARLATPSTMDCSMNDRPGADFRLGKWVLVQIICTAEVLELDINGRQIDQAIIKRGEIVESTRPGEQPANVMYMVPDLGPIRSAEPSPLTFVAKGIEVEIRDVSVTPLDRGALVTGYNSESFLWENDSYLDDNAARLDARAK